MQCFVSFTDDGREITVPVLLDGEESIMEFIDLPYTGVSQCPLLQQKIGLLSSASLVAANYCKRL